MDNISSRFERQGNVSIKNNCRDIPPGGWLHMQTTKGLAISLLVFLLLERPNKKVES
jgi:hypothetical protein